MNALKVKNMRKVWRRGPVTESRVLDNIPADLLDGLTGRQIGQVAALVEAAYLDGYRAAGGETADTIEHCADHRRMLCAA